MIKFRSAADAQYHIFSNVLPNIAKNILLNSGFSEENIKIEKSEDGFSNQKNIEVRLSETNSFGTVYSIEFTITLDVPENMIYFRIKRLHSSISISVGIDENEQLSEKTITFGFESSWVRKKLEQRAAELGRPLNQWSHHDMKEAIGYDGICGLVEAGIQYEIDRCRGWSPYENAEDYRMHKLSNKPSTMEPKTFLPEHDMPERYYNPAEGG